MNAKEKFCRSFDWSKITEWSKEIEWFDLTGYVKIDSDRLAKISLDDNGHKDHYSRFVVEIIDINKGRIDSKSFKFSDYLPANERSDKRTSDYNGPFEGFDGSRGLEWYIAVPKTTKPLCNTIANWINLFR